LNRSGLLIPSSAARVSNSSFNASPLHLKQSLRTLLRTCLRLLFCSGCGQDSATALYWCKSGSAVWNNDGDTGFRSTRRATWCGRMRMDGYAYPPDPQI
jgi:hypothetical protein